MPAGGSQRPWTMFELLAWNQGIGYFSSEIGPSTLFQAYKLIRQQEKTGGGAAPDLPDAGESSVRRTRR